MTDIAIRVEHLSKKYTLGAAQQRHDTLRDLLVDSARGLLRRKPRTDETTLWALRDVSFDIQRGEVVGVIGRNGAGKSTLLKILSRITEPTSGRALINGRVGSLLEVGTGFHPELTGRENIYLNGAILGMRRKEIERKFDEIVAFAEIERFLDTPVKRYSSGMYVRLAFAVAAHLEPEILLVDEVLAVGDAAFQKKCLGKMGDVAKEGRTVLFVSHNMAAVAQLCTECVFLLNGAIAFQGSTSQAIEKYEESITLLSAPHQSPLLPGVVYQKRSDDSVSDYEITKIELLDEVDKPKSLIFTWDRVKIRLHYFAADYVSSGSIVLRISNRYGDCLILLSTNPDSNIQLPLEKGHSYVDCIIDQLPFAAGDYFIGGGIAIPNKKWLYQDNQLAVISVLPKDVYQSGLAPQYPRSLLAVSHKWIV